MNMAKSPRKSQSTKRKVHVVPQIYGCYLLRSIPKPQSFYIGSTPDPVRRLRQHNGHLTAGAYRTKREGTRPWEMVMFVYGFPSKISALMFEHAWQHCYSTRHIPSGKRITTSKTSGRTLAHKLGNARLLLSAPMFRQMGLRVQCFSTDVYKVWCDNKFGVVVSDTVAVNYDNESERDPEVNMAHVTEFKKDIVERDEAAVSKAGEFLKFGAIGCAICSVEVDYINDDSFPLLSVCAHCDCVSHLSCLSRQFKEYADDRVVQAELLSQKTKEKADGRKNKNKDTDKLEREATEVITSGGLIPTKGPCPRCQNVLNWTAVVRTSTRVRAKFGFALDDEDEEEELNEGDKN